MNDVDGARATNNNQHFGSVMQIHEFQIKQILNALNGILPNFCATAIIFLHTFMINWILNFDIDTPLFSANEQLLMSNTKKKFFFEKQNV